MLLLFDRRLCLPRSLGAGVKRGALPCGRALLRRHRSHPRGILRGGPHSLHGDRVGQQGIPRGLGFPVVQQSVAPAKHPRDGQQGQVHVWIPNLKPLDFCGGSRLLRQAQPHAFCQNRCKNLRGILGLLLGVFPGLLQAHFPGKPPRSSAHSTAKRQLAWIDLCHLGHPGHLGQGLANHIPRASLEQPHPEALQPRLDAPGDEPHKVRRLGVRTHADLPLELSVSIAPLGDDHAHLRHEHRSHRPHTVGRLIHGPRKRILRSRGVDVLLLDFEQFPCGDVALELLIEQGLGFLVLSRSRAAAAGKSLPKPSVGPQLHRRRRIIGHHQPADRIPHRFPVGNLERPGTPR